MTTIAFDGVTICYDSCITTDSFPLAAIDLPKAQLISGYYLCCSGKLDSCIKLFKDFSSCSSLEDWLERKPDLKYQDTDVMLIRKVDGKIFMHSETTFIPIKNKLWAVGSGAKYAIGAMAAGATAEHAVHIANYFDPYTNIDTQLLHINAE